MDSINLDVDEKTGKPCLCVPDSLIWSLVEYLAFRRIPAAFSYRDGAFHAVFTRLSAPAAGQLLADWCHYEMEGSQPADLAPIEAVSASEPLTQESLT